MKKIETQIRHLKKEIEEIEERYKNDINWMEKGKEEDVLIRKKCKELKNKILPKVADYELLAEENKKLRLKIANIESDYRKGVLFHTVRFMLFNYSVPESVVPEQLREKGKRVYILMNKLEDKINNIDDKFSLKEAKEFGSGNKLIESYTLQKKAEIVIHKLHWKTRFLNDEMADYEIEEEIKKRDDELKPKYENLERLEKRLAKQKKQRSLANAYLKKNRLDASTIKSRLKDLDICPYCGNEVEELEADHIYPVSSGGLSIAENMVNVCKPCNRNKGHLTLRQFIKRYDLDRDYIENRLDELGKRF